MKTACCKATLVEVREHVRFIAFSLADGDPSLLKEVLIKLSAQDDKSRGETLVAFVQSILFSLANTVEAALGDSSGDVLKDIERVAQSIENACPECLGTGKAVVR